MGNNVRAKSNIQQVTRKVTKNITCRNSFPKFFLLLFQ